MFIFIETGYQLLRNRGRTALLAIVSALLCGCIAFYMGNISANQQALDTINETTPAVVHLLSHDTSRTYNLMISGWRYDILEENGVRDILATSQARGAYSQEARAQESFTSDTSILALTHRDAAQIYSDAPFTFAEGYDSSILHGDEPLCILEEDYAQEMGLKPGDTFSMALQLVQYNWDVVPVYIDMPQVELTVAGTYSLEVPTDFMADMYVPAFWLRELAETQGPKDTTFCYNTLEGPLENSMALNSFKAKVLKMGFLQPVYFPPNGGIEDHVTGDMLYFDDEQFIKTAERLGGAVRMFKAFMLPFFGVIVCLVTLAIFLVLRGSRKDMAIASSLGRPKLLIGTAHLLAALAAEAIGALIAVPLMVLLAGIGVSAALAIGGAFLLCALAGDIIGLWALLRFDALGLLLAAE